MIEAAPSLSQALLDLQSFCQGLIVISEIPQRAKLRLRKARQRDAVRRWNTKNPFASERLRQGWRSMSNHPARLAYIRNRRESLEYLCTFDNMIWRWYPNAAEREYQTFPDLGEALKHTA